MVRWPAEWERHDAVWIGFPGNRNEWPVGLAEAQREVADFANAVSDDGRGEQVLLVCRSDADADNARKLITAPVQILRQDFGDIWLRDTGAIITTDSQNLHAQRFGFNGWGGKFDMPGDQDIGLRLAAQQGLPVRTHNLVLEGGAIDGNGQGAIVTTRQCVLNPNRNGNLKEEKFTAILNTALGTDQICWLGDGLAADHTDGHVDNLARFVDSRTLATPIADKPEDPNAAVFEEAATAAASSGYNVVRLPSVGCYEIDGEIAPASYMNFYIGNNIIAVPQYGAINDQRAVDEIAALFPGRKAVGLSSRALLCGGGSFHCISQQLPAI